MYRILTNILGLVFIYLPLEAIGQMIEDSTLCRCLQVEGPEKYSYFITESDSQALVYIKLINICDSISIDVRHYKAQGLGSTVSRYLPPRKSGMYRFQFYRLQAWLSSGFIKADSLGLNYPYPYPIYYSLMLKNNNRTCTTHMSNFLFQNNPINSFRERVVLPEKYFQKLSIQTPVADSISVFSSSDFGYSQINDTTIISILEIENQSNSIYYLGDVKMNNQSLSVLHGFKHCLLFPHKAVLMQYRAFIENNTVVGNSHLDAIKPLTIHLEFCDATGKHQTTIPVHIYFHPKDMIKD